jgi:hypothetical protein
LAARDIFGFEVLVATNLREALMLLAELRFDALWD